MGSSSSTEEANNAAKNAKKDKLLGDEILQAIISEHDRTANVSKTKIGVEKSAYEKRIKDLLVLQEKFTEYRKRVEEPKDQKIQELENNLEEHKQKFAKINKEKSDLEENLNKKSLDYERIIRDLKEKYNKTEKSLNTERDIRISLEKNTMEMKTLKIDLEAQTKKTEEVQRELDNTRIKLFDEIKLNRQLETKLRDSSSNDDTTKALRDSIDSKNLIIKQVRETLNNTEKRLDKELTSRREALIQFEMKKQLSINLQNEKKFLIDKLQGLEAHFEEKTKQKLEEHEKQLKEVNEKLTAVQKINRLQVKLKKKAQTELTGLEEKTGVIKQLEMKLEEKDRLIKEYLTQIQQKPETELTEHQIQTESINFLKMSEETRVKDLRIKDLQLNEMKSNYDSKLQDQLRRFNRIVYRLKMTEKGRDQLQQHLKNAEGKLNLLENTHKDLKKFCEKELKERKDFLEEFEKSKQEGTKEKIPQPSTSDEVESTEEKIILEKQLDSKTNEIAMLKKQLKEKETEIQNMSSEGQSENRKREWLNFMKSLRKD